MRAPGARFWRAVERFWAKIREEASGEGQGQTFFGSSIAAVGAEDCRGGYEEQQAVVRAEAKARKEREIAEAEREKTASTTPGVRSRRRVKMGKGHAQLPIVTEARERGSRACRHGSPLLPASHIICAHGESIWKERNCVLHVTGRQMGRASRTSPVAFLRLEISATDSDFQGWIHDDDEKEPGWILRMDNGDVAHYVDVIRMLILRRGSKRATSTCPAFESIHQQSERDHQVPG
ncbi:unnamed protein product [Ectocarpus sp. 12 AP-2014]